MFKLLKELTNIHGPCGYEQTLSRHILDVVKEMTDEAYMDSVGNVFAIKKGQTEGSKVAITAHMDEVGFIIKKIEKNGLLRFEKLGGHDDRILLAQKVKVKTKGDLVNGVIGTMSAHFTKFDDPKKVRNHRQLYIDVGAADQEEVKQMGIRIGSTVSWATELDYLGDKTSTRVVGKGLDDRAGCAVILQTLSELKDGHFPGQVTAVFTVQEEVGLRGAQMAANHIEADVAIAIDTTAVSDTPEETMDQTLALGDGVGIKVMDFSLIAHPKVKDFLIDLAEEKEIPFQEEVFTGIGTDGGALSLANKGIPTGVLSIPSRNAHSPVEVIDLEDLNATKNMLKAFIQAGHDKNSFRFD